MDSYLITLASEWRNWNELIKLRECKTSNILSTEISSFKEDSPVYVPCLSMTPQSGKIAAAFTPLGKPGKIALLSNQTLQTSKTASFNYQTLDDLPCSWKSLHDISNISSIELCTTDVFNAAVGSADGKISCYNLSNSENFDVLKPVKSFYPAVNEKHVSGVIKVPSQVSCVRFNVINKRNILNTFKNMVQSWEIEDSSSSPSGLLHINKADPSENGIACSWIPKSEKTYAVVGSRGSIFISDFRAPNSRLYLHLPPTCVGRSIDISQLLPQAVALSTNRGNIFVYDVRNPISPVKDFNSQQTSSTGLAWFPHHTDLLASTGMDGTVKVWSLMHPYPVCVASAQFSFALCCAVVPDDSPEPQCISAHSSGGICSTTIPLCSLAELAPKTLSSYDFIIEDDKFTVLRGQKARVTEQEEQAEALLYCRSLKTFSRTVIKCAQARKKNRDFDFALRLCSLGDILTVPELNWRELIKGNSDRSGSLAKELAIYSCRIPSTANFQSFGGKDTLRLDIMKELIMNIYLERALMSHDLTHVVGVIPIILKTLEIRCGIFEITLVVELAKQLLSAQFEAGVNFICDALNAVSKSLISSSSKGTMRTKKVATDSARSLIESLLILAQEPLSVEPTQKLLKRLSARFCRDPVPVIESLRFQCTIISLSSGLKLQNVIDPANYKEDADTLTAANEIVMCVSEYQANISKSGKTSEGGIFSWISLRPILAYLNSLLIKQKSNIFFWTAEHILRNSIPLRHMQELEKSDEGETENEWFYRGQTPFERCILQMFRGEIMRAQQETEGLVQRLTSCLEIQKYVPIDFYIAVLEESHSSMENIFSILLRSEALASTSHHMPPLIARTMTIFSAFLTDILEAWSEVLDDLVEKKNNMREGDVKKLLTVMTEFYSAGKRLCATSEGKNDENLDGALKECKAFIISLRS